MNKQTRQIAGLRSPDTAIHGLTSLTEVNHCNSMAVNKTVPIYINQKPGLSLGRTGNFLLLFHFLLVPKTHEAVNAKTCYLLKLVLSCIKGMYLSKHWYSNSFSKEIFSLVFIKITAPEDKSNSTTDEINWKWFQECSLKIIWKISWN